MIVVDLDDLMFIFSNKNKQRSKSKFTTRIYFLNRFGSCLTWNECFSSFCLDDEDEDADGSSTPGAQPICFNVFIKSSSLSSSFGGL